MSVNSSERSILNVISSITHWRVKGESELSTSTHLALTPSWLWLPSGQLPHSLLSHHDALCPLNRKPNKRYSPVPLELPAWIRDFSYYVTKYLTGNDLRKGGVILPHCSKGLFHYGEEDMAIVGQTGQQEQKPTGHIVSLFRKWEKMNRKWCWAILPEGPPPMMHFL